VINVKARGQGQETLARAPWMTLLDQLKSRVLSGHEAKITVRDFILNLTREDGELFKKILKKNLRVGVNIATINASNCGLQIPVFGAMLAKTYTGWTKSMYMSLKYDGLRAIYKGGLLYTRNGHVIHGVDHILEQAREHGLATLDGELMVPDMHFQESSGLIRSFNACPTARYYVYDMPGIDAPFTTRYKAMHSSLHTLSVPNILLVKHVMVHSEDRVAKTFNMAIDAGYEGLMLKDPSHLYVPKRSSSWLKIKNVLTADLCVLRVYEGKGKYENSLGGLTAITEGKSLVDVGGGFTDALRAEIWKDPEQYIGQTIEVNYHEETPGGSLRHPRFIKFRFDK